MFQSSAYVGVVKLFFNGAERKVSGIKKEFENIQKPANVPAGLDP
jgi:hypothetical protein